MRVHPTYRRLLTCGVFTVLLTAIVYRSLNYALCHDEIEAVHAAWNVLQGERVYLDFFEHHNPLFYFVLVPMVGALGEHSSTLVVCRLAMLPFVGGMVLITFLLGRRIFGPRTATLAALLLMASPCFVGKIIEVRPDVPQTFFGLLALLLLCPWRGRPSLWACGGAGLCLGISFLFLQKAIFFGAALGIILLWRIARRQMGAPSVLAIVVGVLLPLLPFGWWLVDRNDLQQYIFLNWTLNRHFIGEADPWILVKSATKVLLFQPGICVLAMVALTSFPPNKKRQEMILLTVCTGLITSFSRPPHMQYWLPFLPLVAILAAMAFVRMRGLRSRPALVLLAGFVLLPGVIGAVALDPNRSFLHREPYRELADQLAQIDYVLAITGPQDRVYDGHVRFNVFRKDVDYFWFGIEPADSVLATYRSLRPVEFDLYKIIARTRPKVISTFMISRDDARIKAHYRVSESFESLLIRRDTPAP